MGLQATGVGDLLKTLDGVALEQFATQVASGLREPVATAPPQVEILLPSYGRVLCECVPVHFSTPILDELEGCLRRCGVHRTLIKDLEDEIAKDALGYQKGNYRIRLNDRIAELGKVHSGKYGVRELLTGIIVGVTGDKLSRDFGLTEATAQLERKIREDLSYLNISEWRNRLGQIEVQVCQVETPFQLGTGFLVGPNLVLTNYHVVEDVIKGRANGTQVVLRFDYKELATGGTLGKGTEAYLAKDWLVAQSPYSQTDLLADPGTNTPNDDELDYALLRLTHDVGDEPVAKTVAESGAARRGWITPKMDYPFIKDAPVFIVQHPEANPLKLALETKGVIGLNRNSTRVRYLTNTERGSSGSPVFNEHWEFVALHHSGDRNIVPVYNQGIPIATIIKRLACKGITL